MMFINPTLYALHAWVRGAAIGVLVAEICPDLGITPGNAIWATSARRAWAEVVPFFAVRTRGHFPTDAAAAKLLFLVSRKQQKDWKMPAKEWCMARSQFAILFGERFTQANA